MPFFSTIRFLLAFLIAVCVSQIQADECHLTPVIHKLHYPGCQEKRIPSYACVGRCTSYVKVSGSKIWQAERSCMCCQESGERVAVVALDCSNSPGPKTREVRGHLEVIKELHNLALLYYRQFEREHNTP